MNMHPTKTLGLAVALLLTSSSFAAVFKGQVTDEEGEPLAGVLARFTHETSGISESVYSDAAGKFSLQTSRTGVLQLRLRTPYFRDVTVDLDRVFDGTEHKLELKMTPMTSDREISDSLPAAYHFGALPFEEGDDALFNRYQFQRDCLTCHQMGNPLTRTKRTAEGWVGTIIRMHAMLGNFDAELRDRRSVLLAKGFDGEPLDVRPEFPVTPDLFDAKITEYRMARAIVPHDAIFNYSDGLVYAVDQGADHMAITDLDSGVTEYVSQSGEGMKHFRFGSVAGEIAVFNGRNGPHSLDIGPDGKYYVTNTSTNSIGVFNPATKKWEPSFPIGHGANYPHTIRFDRDGIVWFTLAGSEQVGRLDPQTGKTRAVRLPPTRPGGISAGTTPYGIDTDASTGMVWYTRLFGDKIGKIHPETMKVTEYDSPVKGPRRMRFDKHGTLWLTGYSEGMIAKINTETMETKVYAIPEYAEGYRPAPYALGVHPDSQDIWVNENMTDRIYRFIPNEERWVAYPIPLSGTYTRDMTFTADGQVCTSNNPVPAAALEGGVLQLICIQPNLGSAGDGIEGE